MTSSTAEQLPKRRKREHPEPAREAPMVAGALPFVGHLPRLRKHGLVDTIMSAWRAYGDVYRLQLGPRSALICCHPDAFERVFASHKANFQKGSSYAVVREFLGEGVLTLEDQEWKTRRRLLQPHFHRARLDEMSVGMVRVIERYLDELRARLPEGGVVDMHREMVKLTLDIVFTALFGPQTVSVTKASYEVLADSVRVMDERTTRLSAPRWVPTPANLRFKSTLAKLDEAVYGIIERAKREPSSAATLLGMLLETVDEDSGDALGPKDIRDEVITLYVAGHETTALTMTWLFALADANTHARLEAEVDEVLNGSAPDFESQAQLVYTRQVVDEVLRLRPPVALLSRDPVEEDNLLGFRVHAGDLVMPNFLALHQHPDFWERPAQFDPDRFEKQRVAARDHWAYAPFSAGPRICLGNTFALVEAKLITAMLVQRARWELLPDQDIQPVVVGTVRPSAPVKVRVSWRD